LHQSGLSTYIKTRVESDVQKKPNESADEEKTCLKEIHLAGIIHRSLNDSADQTYEICDENVVLTRSISFSLGCVAHGRDASKTVLG
jgi:hypothetical protein